MTDVEQLRKELKKFLIDTWGWSYENGEWLDSTSELVGGVKDLELFILSKLNSTKEQSKKMVDWCTGDDYGVSSQAIMRFMNGVIQPNHWGWKSSAPSDKWDRGRCIRLLNLFPEWWNRLDEMKVISEKWSGQIDLMKQEADSLSNKEEKI